MVIKSNTTANVRMRTRTLWSVGQSKFSQNTVNPIRACVETLDLTPNPCKQMIALSIGDPTVFGNLKPCEAATEAVVESVKSTKYNGYAPSTGYQTSREAVASYISCPGAEAEAKDVVLTSGCSHAIEMCISVLANPGQNILVPRPGFALYRTVAEGVGINTKPYALLPSTGWEVDLVDLESQIDSQTVAIVVNNPSNPCGSVFSKEHLRAILDIAAKNYVPIIADEIYDFFVFPGREFYPIAALSSQVPVLTCGGLTKRYLVPGWRMGWIVIHDRNDIFGHPIRKGLLSLSQRIMGSNTVVQGALPAILASTPKSFFDDTISLVQGNAEVAFSALVEIPGLNPVMPSGAMYMMNRFQSSVGLDMESFPDIRHDLDFVEKLVSEQSVFCLPGLCFDYPNYFRIVLTVPGDQLREACDRIAEFCKDHFIRQSSIPQAPEIIMDTPVPMAVMSRGS